MKRYLDVHINIYNISGSFKRDVWASPVMIHQLSDGNTERKSVKVGLNIIGTLVWQDRVQYAHHEFQDWDTEKRLESWNVYCCRVGAIAGCPITKTDIDGNRERMESCPILFNYKEKYRWEGGSSDSGNVRPWQERLPVPLERSHYLSNNQHLFSKQFVCQRCQECSREFRTICGQTWIAEVS